MATILCTGIVTLDIVNTVPHYPLEDEELRAIGQQRRLGGNAANTAQILAQHGDSVSLLSAIADDGEGAWILQQLKDENVQAEDCPVLNGVTPTSYITLNKKTGSRTIVHYRKLPELSFAQFTKIKLDEFSAFHFEGRNISELVKMLRHCRKKQAKARIFLEVEKPREDIESLFQYADVIMFSQDYATRKGHENGEALLSSIAHQFPDTPMSCTWGSSGVYFRDAGEEPQQLPAEYFGPVIDTIGAGDSFNAGLIHSLSNGSPFAEAVSYANELAARKVTQAGFAGLVS
ncbi:MAG: PfkB family carbohydrate kinase [Thiotrichales bacterium]